ncbi:MDR family MFS transporter [Rubeoparvulum massiliense]|uniref:MDR family MFS transporter n=1 Tax=Rubeoparvulum massiliense TaxID=1631346 RepID=UPI00065E225A|nr:MDR family MFS transporter [Rubeoparvulum massiliense]
MRKGIIIASLTLGMLLAAMDTTILSTSLPEISHLLGDFQLYSLVFAAYMLTSTVTVPLYGKLADMYGRKRVYLVAIFLFVLGSALCGFAGSMQQLALFRAIQGLGAGGVIPLTVTIAGDLFPIEQRGTIQGLFSSMWGIAGISGPLLGGWMIEYFHWSWIFWINIPIGFLAFIGITFFKEEVEVDKQPIDLGGAMILMSAIATFIVAANSTTLTDRVMLGGISLALFLLFYGFEKRRESQLIRLDLLKQPMMLWINLSTVMVTMGVFVLPTFIPLYGQYVLGYSPIKSGLLILGQVIGWNLMAVPSGRLIMKVGYKKSINSGIAVMLSGALILILFFPYLNYPLLFFSMFVLGLGFGIAMTSFIIGVQEAVTWRERGISTSVQMFARNMGATIGVAVVGGILNFSTGASDVSALVGNPQLSHGFFYVFITCFLITLGGFFFSLRIPAYQEGRAGEQV